MKTIAVSPELADAIRWLQEETDRTAYGSVGVTLTMHGGKVSKISRSVTESLKPPERYQKDG